MKSTEIVIYICIEILNKINYTYYIYIILIHILENNEGDLMYTYKWKRNI